MSVEAGASWTYDSLEFFGLSLSGIRTSIAMPDFQICFDVATGFPFTLNLKNFFITHGHLDHAAGIPYIISQKAMHNQAPGRFFMPASLVEPMKRIMNEWELIEKHQYCYEFVPLAYDEEVELNSHYFVKTFPTTHRIDSLGYTLFRRSKKLKEIYSGLSESQIIALKKSGETIATETIEPLVSFTGDTQIEFLYSRDWVAKSKILILECTYLDDKKSVENARKWGHTHLDEILLHVRNIESQRIVLIHLSSRYSLEYAKKIIEKKLPQDLHSRVVIFPGR